MSDSAIYQGRVTHHRYAPREHRFAYRVIMFWLFLDEVGALSRELGGPDLEGRVLDEARPRALRHLRPGRFTLRREDFLPEYPGSLEAAARAMYRDLTGLEAPGRVALLANLRSLGWNFNPIALYCFYDGDDLVNTIAEVTNTPWGERHCYVLGPPGTTTFAKAHHVSPFLEMDGRYRLTYQAPGEHLVLSMALDDGADGLGPRRFTAALRLDREALTATSLRRAGRRHPAAALAVSTRIYVQAARLVAKGIAYVPHPPPRPRGVDRDVPSRHHRP